MRVLKLLFPLLRAMVPVHVLLLSVHLYVSGCFNAFPLKTDTDTVADAGTDTISDTDSLSDADTDTISDTDTDTVSDTGTASCPKGIKFVQEAQFTLLADCDYDGSEYVDKCPGEQVVIGLKGLMRPPGVDELAHGTMQAICGVPSIRLVDGECVVKIDPGVTLPERGTFGEIEWAQTCPPDEMIMGYKAWIGHTIYQLVLRCAPLAITEDGGGHTITRGFYSDLEPVGAVDGPGFAEDDCPDGQVARATKLEADHMIRAFALGCQAPLLVY